MGSSLRWRRIRNTKYTPQGIPKSPSRWRFWDTLFLLEECGGYDIYMGRRSGAKHCSSLCSQSEGDEYCGGQARAENSTKSCPRALVMFATCSWPSLCEQSELQCWRRNKRLYGPGQISAARALPLTFDISILNALPFQQQRRRLRRQLTKNPPVHILNRGITYKVYLIFTFHANGRFYSLHKLEFQPCLLE